MVLSRLRVVELGRIPAGAYCARLFADFGADVVKVEPPEGDAMRRRLPGLPLKDGGQESCYFGFLNLNKTTVTATADQAADRQHVAMLVANADVLVDSLSPDERRQWGIDHAAFQRENPQLTILSISWFGESGPYSGFKGTDAVCRALAGLVYLVGPQDGPPMPLMDYQGDIVAGLTAFIPAMAATHDPSARGRRFELSVHEANICIADYNIALDWSAKRRDRRWGKNRFWPNYPLGVFRCKQGWIGVTIVTPVQWASFCELLRMPDLIGDPRYAVNRDRIAMSDDLQARFEPVFLERTADEWFELALKHHLPFVVVPSMADLLDNPEHRRRGALMTVSHGGRRYDMPASPWRLTQTPPRTGGAVPTQASADLGQKASAWSDRVRFASGEEKKLPLAGIRVADLSMGWAGPHATRHLADLGADVIKVEACQYPDWWRGVDNRPIVIEQRLYEKSGYFNVMNRNKRDITLDLTTPEGVALTKELVRNADIVVENYSSGVLTKLGLDYAALREVNPSIIMVSMPAFAADGIWREARAYGSTLEQAAGIPSVGGPADAPPAMNHIAYGDPIGGMNAAAAILVALTHRLATGEGQRIDLSQVECMLPMVAPWLIEQSATGSVLPRHGTRHPSFVPYGSFPCKGDDAWVFVAVEDAAQWQALCDLVGGKLAALGRSWTQLEQRSERQDEIEIVLAAWTRERTGEAAMQELQRHGIPAGVAYSPVDLLNDPHLQARGFWQELDRPWSGPQPNPSPAYREGDRPYALQHPAPTLGQHNHVVLRDIIGLSEERIAALAEKNIIGTEAVPPSQRKARAAVGRTAATAAE